MAGVGETCESGGPGLTSHADPGLHRVRKQEVGGQTVVMYRLGACCRDMWAGTRGLEEREDPNEVHDVCQARPVVQMRVCVD